MLVNGSYSSVGTVRHGVPQGSILGPLLFCVFINDMPLYLRDKKLVCDMFADDATIHTPDKDLSVVNVRLQKGLQEISNWCDYNHMVLNPSKTTCMVIATRQKQQLAPLSLALSLADRPIEQVSEHRLLGVTVDNQLQWKSHITNVCKKISRNLFMLSKLRLITDTETRKIFYNAHIRSHIDYASTVWDGSSEANLKRLNSLHRRAAKLILPDPDLSADQKLDTLGILPLHKHLQFNKAAFVFKSYKQPSPCYISDFFTEVSSSHSSRSGVYLMVPRPRIDIFKTSLSYSGTRLWNTLPEHVRDCQSLRSFKGSLFRYLRTAQ